MAVRATVPPLEYVCAVTSETVNCLVAALTLTILNVPFNDVIPVTPEIVICSYWSSENCPAASVTVTMPGDVVAAALTEKELAGLAGNVEIVQVPLW